MAIVLSLFLLRGIYSWGPGIGFRSALVGSAYATNAEIARRKLTCSRFPHNAKYVRPNCRYREVSGKSKNLAVLRMNPLLSILDCQQFDSTEQFPNDLPGWVHAR